MAHSEVKYEDRSEFSVTCKWVNGVQQALVHNKVFVSTPAASVKWAGEKYKIVETTDEVIRNLYRKKSHKYIDTVVIRHDPQTGQRLEWLIWFETAEKGMW